MYTCILGDMDDTVVHEVTGPIPLVSGVMGPLTNLMLIRHALLGPT